MPSREWMRLLALVPVSGLAWWLIGYMPWIVTGLNGRSGNVPDAGAGIAGTALALPFANASYSLLAAGALVGGLAADSPDCWPRVGRSGRASRLWSAWRPLSRSR